MAIDTNLDPSQLVVGATGLVLVSPEGTDFPTDIADVPDSLDADWVSLGYTDENGPAFTFDRTIKDINGWQSFYTLRSLVTAVPSKVEFVLRQWNSDTIKLGVGGAVVTSAGSGTLLEPEDASFLDIRQLLVYGVDGDKHYAFGFRRAQNTRSLTFPFKRDDESGLPIGMNVLGPPAGETSPWFLLTDDPAIVADGS